MSGFGWQLVVTVLVSVGVSVLTTVVLRFIPWGQPRMATEAANRAREALSKAEWVFGQSSASGGRLQHPWETTSGEIYCHDLETLLSDAHDRVSDKKFRMAVKAAKVEIHGVWVTEFKAHPAIWYVGKQESPGEIAREKEAQVRAHRQLSHAHRGEKAVKEALARLSKLATRA